MTFLAIISLMILMTIYVVTFPKYGTEQITVAFFGIFYVGIMFSYLYQCGRCRTENTSCG